MEELQSPSVSLREIRNVPETINATVDFLRLHGRRLRKLIFIRAFPPLLFGGIISTWTELASLDKQVPGNSGGGNPILRLLLTLICYSISYTLLVGITHSYMRYAGEYTFEEFDEADVWEDVKESFWRVFGTNLGLSSVVAIGGSFLIRIGSALTVNVPVIGSLLFFFACLCVITLWSLYFPARLIDDYGFFESFGRSQRLVQGRFWQTSGFIIIWVALCAAIILIPTWLFVLVIQVSDYNAASVVGIPEHSLLATILVGTMGVVIFSLNQLLSVIPMASLVLYYQSQAERKEAHALGREIEKIGMTEEEVGEIDGEAETTGEGVLPDPKPLAADGIDTEKNLETDDDERS